MTEVLMAQANSLHIPLMDKSVHTIVTSPPYWGLRDYLTGEWHGGDPDCTHAKKTSTKEASITTMSRPSNTNHEREPWKGGICGRCGAVRIDAQLGPEATHDCLGWATGDDCGICYLCHMRAVWRECWRVLRDDGTCWLNIGDSYASGWPCAGRNVIGNGSLPDGKRHARPSRLSGTLKEKDMCLIPQRLALALQSEGWYVRSDIIWNKTNGMPEPAHDRPARFHEYVWLLTKKPQYFYDAEAMKEAALEPNRKRHDRFGGANGHLVRHGLQSVSTGHSTRIIRDVWTMNTEPTTNSHFACMPMELASRCIQAGTSSHGVCSACAAPWVRMTEATYNNPGNRTTNGPRSLANRHQTAGFPVRLEKEVTTLGWQATCACNAPVTPAIVFDPFVGSGTTLVAAHELGRSAIGLDLSWQYLSAIARPRLNAATQQGQLFPIRCFPVAAPTPQPQQEVLL